jgi:hypothetical protein
MSKACARHGIRYAVHYLATWWPRTKVAQYHEFDVTHMYLLTLAIHEWWSGLRVEVESSDYKWPASLSEDDRCEILSIIKENALVRSAAAARAERIMLNAGKRISPTSEVQLSG